MAKVSIGLLIISIAASYGSLLECCNSRIILINDRRTNNACSSPRGLLAMDFGKNYKLMLPSGRGTVICCCPERNTEGDIKWYLNGSRLQLENSSFRTFSSTSIYSFYTLSTDSGNYECRQNKGEDNYVAAVTVRILESEPYCGIPKNCVIEPDTHYALLRTSRTFSCQGYAGEAWSGVEKGITFHKLQNGQLILANTLPNVTVEMSFKHEVIHGKLLMQYISKRHFGEYFCVIKNNDLSINMSFSLVEGVQQSDIYLGGMATTLVVIIFWGLTAAAVLVLIICRPSLPLRKTFIIVEKEKEFLYDVAIIHGEDAVHFVYSELLPFLEKNLQLRCYAPYRDALGGEGYAEDLLERIPNCRRVLVVLSKELLSQEWSSFACHSAVHAAARRSTTICCIEFKNMQVIETNSTTDYLMLKMLKQCKTLVYPTDLENRKYPTAILPLQPLNSPKAGCNGFKYINMFKTQKSLRIFHLQLLKFVKFSRQDGCHL